MTGLADRPADRSQRAVGMRFRHDDGVADASTRYHATVTVTPAGDFDPDS